MLPWTRWVRDQVLSCDRCGNEEDFHGDAGVNDVQSRFTHFRETHQRCIVDRGARPAASITVREELTARLLVAFASGRPYASTDDLKMFVRRSVECCELLLEELALGPGISETEFDLVVEASRKADTTALKEDLEENSEDRWDESSEGLTEASDEDIMSS